MTPAPNVVVVIVTYGNRWTPLSRVLAALLANDPPIAEIVVVDNGSPEPVTDRATALDPRIHVVRLASNTGSAAGFRAGIDTAHRRAGGEMIWLLDDDNRPAPGALRELLECYAALGGVPENTVAGIRPDLREFVLAAGGFMRIRVPPDSFLGFHVGLVPEKALRRLRVRGAPATAVRNRERRVEVQYAPYGGLLFHRSWVDRIGLPREDFYLYGDDYEYTSRIAGHGGRIVLCPAAVIEDLEQSWHRKASRAHVYFDREASLHRLYYSIRNGVFLERSRFVRSRLLYGLNRVVFLAGLAAHSLAVDRDPRLTFGRLRLLRRAMADGDHGRLGCIADSEWGAKLASGARSQETGA